jgi:hypothetical protein
MLTFPQVSAVKVWWSGTGSNCRPSAFQEVYHPETTYLEKPPTAQLTRIDAADRLFSGNWSGPLPAA